MSGAKIFMHLIKCKSQNIFKLKYICINISDEKNDNLRSVYKQKMDEFCTRAEYIKKQTLNKPENQIAPDDGAEGGGGGGGSGASASAGKKPKSK